MSQQMTAKLVTLAMWLIVFLLLGYVVQQWMQVAAS